MRMDESLAVYIKLSVLLLSGHREVVWLCIICCKLGQIIISQLIILLENTWRVLWGIISNNFFFFFKRNQVISVFI